ncbi:MAG: BMP family ABC transporter substrate-binding protein [Spirochaetales bacterium]|nr:BMP family ABC transporter substrate-binding protein [Candidatus Physcosoma equi]
MSRRNFRTLYLALLFCLVLLFSSCVKKGNSTSTVRVFKPDASETLKIGFIVLNDENDQGYTYNFMVGMNNALKKLRAEGYSLDLHVKRNVGEDAGCADANGELAEEGCAIIFNNSFGFEPYMLQVASEYPNTNFVAMTNSAAQTDGNPRTYNAFASIYEGRYVSGVAAGMKLQELIENGRIKPEEAVIGYVGAYSFAEVVSGMTAFYLGARSVCPSCTMRVQFVGSWSDPTLEAEAAQALIDDGAVIISQHSDNTTPATTAQKNGVYHTGYNNDMTGVAPDASLLSCRIDWTEYFYTFIENYLRGVQNPADYTGTLSSGAVVLTKLNEAIAAPGTKEAIERTVEDLKKGRIHVFDLSTFTIDGHTPTNLEMYDSFATVSGNATYGGYFHESEYQSAPYFVGRIDGITWMNVAY